PELLDVLRILADQPSGALLQHVLGSTLANSHNTGVSLNGDNQVALVEKWIRIRRRIHANPGNLALRNRGLSAAQTRCSGDRCRPQRFEESSSIHLCSLPESLLYCMPGYPPRLARGGT